MNNLPTIRPQKSRECQCWLKLQDGVQRLDDVVTCWASKAPDPQPDPNRVYDCYQCGASIMVFLVEES